DYTDVAALSTRMVVSSPLFTFFTTRPTNTGTYTLSLHDALPISECTASSRRKCRPRRGLLTRRDFSRVPCPEGRCEILFCEIARDRKSTRLNSSHRTTSYAVFCLKKKSEQAERVHGERDRVDVGD